MPRIPPARIRQAFALSPHLGTLLPVCRELESARNELRWIREHVASSTTLGLPSSSSARGWEQEEAVARLVARRGRGEPLQYLLGPQPFGALDIACRPGVLIPRGDTEAWASYLADRLPAMLRSGGRMEAAATTTGNRSGWTARRGEEEKTDDAGARVPRQTLWKEGPGGRPVRILDLCTGSGCIALLLAEKLFRVREPRVLGLDINDAAVQLAAHNLDANVRGGALPWRLAEEQAVRFERANIFGDVDWPARLAGWEEPPGGVAGTMAAANDDDAQPGSSSSSTTTSSSWDRGALVDVLVSNPPYISQYGFDHGAERSVRSYEPREALIPEVRTDDDDNNDEPAAAAATERRRSYEMRYDCPPEDVFYGRLYEIARTLKPSVMLFEVGDTEQAVRVARMAEKLLPPAADSDTTEWYVEIWRDEPLWGALETHPSVELWGNGLVLRGQGHGRSVLVCRRRRD